MLHGHSHLHQPIALTSICKQPNYSIPRDFNSFRNTLSCTKFFVLFSFILSAVVLAINTAANMDHPGGYRGMSYACGMHHCFDGEKQYDIVFWRFLSFSEYFRFKLLYIWVQMPGDTIRVCGMDQCIAGGKTLGCLLDLQS